MSLAPEWPSPRITSAATYTGGPTCDFVCGGRGFHQSVHQQINGNDEAVNPTNQIDAYTRSSSPRSPAPACDFPFPHRGRRGPGCRP